MDLNHLAEKIRQDWEKAVFAAAAVLCAVSTVSFLLGLWGQGDGKVTPSSPAPPARALLGDNAYLFMLDPSLPQRRDDPFAFSRSFAKPQPQRPAQPPGQAGKPGGTHPPGGQGEKPATPPPPAPPGYLTVEYAGWFRSSSGEELAFVNIFDSKTQKTTRLRVATGQMVGDLSVISVDTEKLVVARRGSTDKTSVNINGSEKVILE